MCHALRSPLHLGAGAQVTLNNFAGLLVAEKRAAPSIWHLCVSWFILLLLPFCRSVKNSTVWTSLARSFKVHGRIEVKLSTFKRAAQKFLN